jgi:hypothetical protein
MPAADIVFGPLRTFLRLYGAILAVPPPGKTLVMLALGMAAGWWVYVPVHELLHAAGCLLCGGTVSQLDILPMYGGALLARLIPFVNAGGNYAGRLSGFDTHGSDGCYFVTVYFPFLLSLGGLWLMEAAAARRSVFLFGAALPCALAPLLSLSGDFLEIGSLALYQVWPGTGDSHRQLISDDLFRLVGSLPEGGAAAGWDAATAGFIACSLVIGAVLAWATLVAADRLRAVLPPHMEGQWDNGSAPPHPDGAGIKRTAK